MSQRVDFSMAFLKMQSLSLAELGLINNFWSARIRDIFPRHRGPGTIPVFLGFFSGVGNQSLQSFTVSQLSHCVE